MTYNENLLNDLMTSMKESAPVMFADKMDSLLKAKCADAIDLRRNDLASEINEAKDNEGADYTGNDADADSDSDKDKDGEDTKKAKGTVNEDDEESDEDEDDEESDD